jgi:hypothetical protein
MNMELQKRVIEICCQKQGCFKTKVNGDCMYPFIRNGESVSVFSYSDKEPMVGDIVLILINKDMYVHRLLKIKNSGVIAKGDMNVKLDDPVPIDNIAGFIRRYQSYNNRNKRLIRKLVRLSYKAGIYFEKNIFKNREKCLESMRKRKKRIISISRKVIKNDH